MDNPHVGPLESVRSIDPNMIRSIRHVDGITATARRGLDHGAGVSLVITQR